MAQNADINALLAKLSKVQPLSKTTSAFPEPTQQISNQVRDSVIDNVRRAPSLQESLNQVAQTGQTPNAALGVAAKIFGNPVVKTALYPLLLADTARRGVISGAREIADLVDKDPNTKASWSDFGKQTKDFSFGYGTAFPMDGWAGRIAGFLGDVVADPLTYATLGGAVPAKAMLRGTNILTRDALGGAVRAGAAAKILGRTKPVRFITAEGRNNLATLVGNQARQINLLDDAQRSALKLFKRSENDIQVIEQAVAKYGKTRVPQDIARDIGLPKAGIYYFGSRVKVPLSGPIGTMLEHGLAGTRTRITSRTTGAIGRFIESLTPEGVASDAINVKDMRRALITGKATPEQASTYLKLLGDNQQRRVIENFTKEAYTSSYNQRIASNPLIKEHSTVINELLENPERLASATVGEKQAAKVVQDWFAEMHSNIAANLQRVDPNFELNTVRNYFPHQQTEKALAYVDDLRNPFVEQLRVYLKSDLSDPSSAFTSRSLIENKPFFGHVLTKEDLAGGVKRLNQIAREKGQIDFDFFETDALKVLQKYGDSYAVEISKAHFFERQLSEGGVLKQMQASGIYDNDYLASLEIAVKDAIKNVTGSSRDVAKTAGGLRQVLKDALDTFGTQTKRTTKKLKGAARTTAQETTVARKSLADVKRAIDSLVESLQATGIKDAQERFDKFGLNGLLVDSQIDEPLDSIVRQIEQIATYMKMFDENLANGTKSLANITEELDVLNGFATALEKEAMGFHTRLNEFDAIHDVLGDFINGRFSQLAMDNAEEGGGEGFERVVSLIKNQSLRDQVGLTKGKTPGRIAGEKISALWGDTAATNDPRVAALKQILDPDNKVTSASVRRLTIDNVRDILSRSVVKASSLTELRDAMVWMVIRDIDRSPSLLDSILLKEVVPSASNSLDNLVNNSGTVSRIARIKETIEKINNLDRVINNTSRKASRTNEAGITYTMDNIVDLETRIKNIDDAIAEAKIEQALLEGRVEIAPLREWKRISSGRENEIVQNPKEIEDLFNNILGSPQRLDIADSVDLEQSIVNEFKNAGLENGKLTYGDVAIFLENYADIVVDTPDDILKFGKEVGAARQRINNLIETRNGLTTQKKKNAPRIDSYTKENLSAALDANSYAETVLEHSNQALEYYLYSEAKNQFNNIMDALEPWGVKPSYGVYQRILGDVAQSHIVKVDAFAEQVDIVENLFKQIEIEVAGQPAKEQGTYLRGVLQRELNDEVNGSLLDAVFPEVRASVAKTKMSDFSRVQARDEVLTGYVQDIVTRLRGITNAETQTLTDNILKNQNNINAIAVVGKVKKFLSENSNLNIDVSFSEFIARIEPEIVGRVNTLKEAQKTAKLANKQAGLAAGARKAGAQATSLRKASKGDYNFGLVGSLDLALEGSTSVRVKAFFANLKGGTTVDKSSGQIYTGVAKTIKQESNQLRKFKTVSPENSLIGVIKTKLSERAAALRATTDLDYNVAGLAEVGSVVPGLTLDRRAARSAMGVKAYAEWLSERATELEATIMGNQEYAARIRDLRSQVDAAESLDIPKEMRILELLKEENVVSNGATLFRISPQTDISTLPKSIQKQVIEARKLKISAAKLMQTDEFLAARHEQNLNSVLHELAAIDAWRIVDANGESGIFLNQSGLEGSRIWNAPREGATDASNLDDLAVARFVSNQQSVLVSGKENALAFRSPEKANYSVRRMTEIPFDVRTAEFENPNYHYIIPEGNSFRKLVREDLDTMTEEMLGQVRALRFKPGPNYLDRKKWLKSGVPDYESRVKSRDKFIPSETWVQFYEEAAVKGAAGTSYEGMITRASVPEVWLPLKNVIPIEQSKSLLDVNFTAAEWEALFVPGPITEKGKLQELVRVTERHNQARIRFADLSRSAKTRAQKDALLQRFDNADKAYTKAKQELDLYNARTTARVKLNRLVERFDDPEVAKALDIALRSGKQATPADTARAFVKRQLGGKGDDLVSVNADSQRRGVAQARRKRMQQGWKESQHYPIIKELDDIHKKGNDLAFGQYSKSIKQQWESYVNVLEELKDTKNAWTADQATINNAKLIAGVLDDPKVTAIAQPARQLSPTEISKATEEEVQRLLASGDAADEAQALSMIEAHNANLETTAATVRDVATGLDEAPPQLALEATTSAPGIRAGLETAEQTSLRLAEETKVLIQDLDFDKLLKTRSVEQLTKVVNQMSTQERSLLSAKAKRLAEMSAIDGKRLDLINKALGKAGVRAKGGDPVQRLMQLSEAHKLSISSFDLAKNLERNALGLIDESEAMLETINDIASRAKNFTNVSSKNLDWIPEFEAWRDEAVSLLEMLSKNNNMSVKTRAMLTTYADAVNALQLSKASLGAAQADLAAERGIKMMFDQTGIGANMLIKELEKGYEFLNKDSLPNVMVKQAYAEILRNGNQFKEPLVGASLQRTLKKWNSYWKPLATTTPGFHVRNNISNIMALVFGGASPFNLREATEVTTKWFTASRSNIGWDDFVKTLTPEQQVRANTAHWAVAATGGGVYSDVAIADNFVQRRKVVAASKKFGYDADSFARFVFSYDAAMQGFSPEQAAIRTKRFYIDYEDVSSLDKTMRQIVPFWMWTSRNVVTQVQNMWLNPKPYLVYNSFKRNFEDKDSDNVVSKSWRELGAFKLPFGKDLYAQPDLGFTKVQQQLEMAKNPSRFLSEISPLLRVPAELALNTKVYNQRKFKDEPVEVSGVGLASAVQPLAQLLGMGQSNARGQKFIDEKALYALTAMLPPLSIADRLIPSTGSEAGGLDANALAGFFGSPIKQLTPKMEQNEMLRRLFEIQKISSKNQAVNNPQG